MEESISWGQNSTLSVSSCCTLLEKHQQISGNSFKHSKNLHTMQENNKWNLSEYLNYTVCLCSFLRSPLEIKSKREKKIFFSPFGKYLQFYSLGVIDFSGKKKCDFSVRRWTRSCGFTQSSIMLFCYIEIHNVFTVLVICFVNDQKLR